MSGLFHMGNVYILKIWRQAESFICGSYFDDALIRMKVAELVFKTHPRREGAGGRRGLR
jgi:hypothetical protein